MGIRPLVQLVDINKSYEDNHVVKDVSLDVNEGEFLTILGPSGSGKTTLLRMIAGFEDPDSGQVLLNGEDVCDKAPYERDVNTVFQSYALFPHMSVFENVAYGLKMRKVPKAEIPGRVADALRLVQLSGFEERMPSQLSGGQRQRVAVARAVVNRPKILLLDEPLGALDLKLRKQMQLELKDLQRALNITFLYVTHDQEEALTMSDRIAVMHAGVLEQVASPRAVYEEPASRFVATFIGETNLFEGEVAEVDATGLATVDTECGPVLVRAEGLASGMHVTVSVRPERMACVAPDAAPEQGFGVRAEVCEQVYVGSVLKTIVRLSNGAEVRLERLAGDPLPADGIVQLLWNPEDARVCERS